MSAATAASPARIAPDQRSGLESEAPRAIADRIRSNGSVCFRVFGGSMFPWIRAGDIVFARRSEIEQAKAGEAVLFERDSRLFVHRVLRPAKGGSGGHACVSLFTKGDALDGEDAPVSSEEFLGRVIRLHRKRRHIDLESFGQVFRGRVLARVSRRSFLLYRPLRMIKRLLFA